MQSKVRALAVVLLFMLSACTGKETKKDDQALGQEVYSRSCIACHQANGQGVAGLYPPIAGTEWTNSDKGRLIRLLLNGMQGPVTVLGKPYNNAMTPHAFLKDEEIAAVLTYVRTNFGNSADAVTQEEVSAVRAASRQQGLWLSDQLENATGIPGR